MTICQVERVAQLEYFHIELDSHEVILADGAPAETFIDTDNRGMFHNAAEFAVLYPDEQSESRELCAPRVDEDSPELTAIRRALLERAEALGRTTRDPGLHLISDGDIVHPVSGRDGIYQFAVAAGTRRVALVSRSAVPAEVYPFSLDGRALGVPVERIVLRDAGLRVEIGHNCPALGEGFNDDEASYRWSDGRGCLPEGLLGCFAGDIAIEVHLAQSALVYPCDPAAAAAEPDATEDPQQSASGAGPTRKVVARSLSADRPVAVAAQRIPATRSPTATAPT